MFLLHLSFIILTFPMILSFLLNLVKIYFLMMLLLLFIHKTRGMSIFHRDVERMNLLLLIFLISHLIFLKTQWVKFIIFHLPLFAIHQFMMMPPSVILKFMIMAVTTSSLIHPVTIMIFFLLVFPSHQSMMIHLLMSWNFPKLSRHFSSS